MTKPLIRLPAALEVALATLLLLAVGAVNGRPSVFPDTAVYYSQGEYFATAFNIVSDERPAWRRTDSSSVTPGSPAMVDRSTVSIAGARSPSYGLLLFLSHAVGGLWLLAAIQGALAAWMVHVAARAFAPAASKKVFWTAITVLGLGSSLPFFTTFAMPDVFGGVSLLCAVVLLLAADRLPRWERWAVWLLLVAGLSFHKTNLLTTAILLAGGAGALALLKLDGRRAAVRLSVVAGALIAAIGLSSAMASFYRAQTGVAQTTPPFLMARIMADGPGQTYLRRACAQGERYVLCRYKGVPVVSEEVFLWAEEPGRGVFSAADYATRRALKDEELRFVLGAVAHSPFASLKAAARNWSTQLGQNFVHDPLRNPAWFFANGWPPQQSPAILVPGIEVCRQDESACAPRFAMRPLARYHQMVITLSLLFGTLLALRAGIGRTFSGVADETTALMRTVMVAAGLLTFGVLVNAAVCGVLAGPFPRYQARLIWLAPLAAVLMAFGLPYTRAAAVKGQRLTRLKRVRTQA